MKFLFVIDPIKNINPLKDSTAALMQATDLRNIEVWFCTPQDLEARGDEVWASSTKTKPNHSPIANEFFTKHIFAEIRDRHSNLKENDYLLFPNVKDRKQLKHKAIW